MLRKGSVELSKKQIRANDLINEENIHFFINKSFNPVIHDEKKIKEILQRQRDIEEKEERIRKEQLLREKKMKSPRYR